MYVATFLGMALFYVIPVQSPFLFKQIGVENESLLGIGLIVATIFAALGSRLHPIIKRRISFATIYVVTFGMIALGFGVVALSADFWMILTGTLIAGFGAGLIMPNGNLWIIQITRPEARGKAIGGLTTAVFLGQFFSPVLLQPIITNSSIFIAHGVAAIFALFVGGVYIFLALRQPGPAVKRRIAS